MPYAQRGFSGRMLAEGGPSVAKKTPSLRRRRKPKTQRFDVEKELLALELWMQQRIEAQSDKARPSDAEEPVRKGGILPEPGDVLKRIEITEDTTCLDFESPRNGLYRWTLPHTLDVGLG
jgi:hypothetical protein